MTKQELGILPEGYNPTVRPDCHPTQQDPEYSSLFMERLFALDQAYNNRLRKPPGRLTTIRFNTNR